VNEGKNACDAKAIDELELQGAFVRLFNNLKEDQGSFINTLNTNIEKVLSQRVGNGVLIPAPIPAPTVISQKLE
jgi:site-specific DNA recombinase